MVARMSRTLCDNSKLRDLVEDRLSEVEVRALSRHLDVCANCRSDLERIAGDRELWNDLRGFAGKERRFAATTEREAHSDIDLAAVELPADFLAPADLQGSLGRLAGFEVTQIIGAGGFGIVLKAFDPALNRTLAIKALSPRLATHGPARARFAREAKAAAAVVHDNVVPIHAVDSWRGIPYFVMPFIEGGSLQERVNARGPLDVKESLRIGMQTALGLEAAHAQGIIHRDVKPANILLENGVERVKLSDFGLARSADDSGLSQSGVVTGTPQYMSPEQARGETIDRRSDLFSLGGVMYFMCCGTPPFRADSTPVVLKRVCDDRPKPIREINPDVPAWLEAIILRLLEKDPRNRFGSAAEVADRLRCRLAEVQSGGRARTGAGVGRGTIFAAGAFTLAIGALYAAWNGQGPLAGIVPIVASTAANPQEGDAIVGSGKLIEKSFDVHNFTQLEIGSAFQAVVVQSDEPKVVVTIDDNLMEFVRVTNIGGSLKVGIEAKTGIKPSKPYSVAIAAPVLASLRASGAVNVSLENTRKEKTLDLEVSGSSTVRGGLKAEILELSVNGASTIELKGSAQRANVSASGASALKLKELEISRGMLNATGASTADVVIRSDHPVEVKVSGSSTLHGVIEAQDLELDASEASHVKLSARARTMNLKATHASSLELDANEIASRSVSIAAESASHVALAGKTEALAAIGKGSSDLKLARLRAGAAEIVLEGASSARVEATESLVYSVVGGSHLEYSGSPAKVIANADSGSSATRRPATEGK